jgi:hypothetical protein
MKNRGVMGLIGAAVALLVIAYFLSRTSAEVTPADAGPQALALAKAKEKKIVYPRDQYKGQGALATERVAPTPEKRAKLDAMQRALLTDNKKGAVFVEANAIRHAPLMEKILRCRSAESADGLTQMKEELGIDPLEDVDRVGFDGDVFVASGFFKDLKVPAELGAGTPYGEGGKLWSVKGDDGEAMTFGQLGDGMLVSGPDEAAVKAAMDRAGSTSDAPSELPEGFGQGEVYGTVGAAFLQSVLGASDDPVAKRVAELVSSSTVRMNVGEDAALSLDMKAVDEKSAKELSSAVGGAFAGLRMQAQQSGDAELAYLLEQARVEPQPDGRFNIDVAVPGEVLLKGMGCGPDGEPLIKVPGATKPKEAPAAPARTDAPPEEE